MSDSFAMLDPPRFVPAILNGFNALIGWVEPTKSCPPEHLTNNPPLRVPGTAVVLDRMAKGVALALSHNIRCSHILYENVLLVAVTTTEPPRVSDEDAVVVTPIAEGITQRRS